jgi:cyclase
VAAIDACGRLDGSYECCECCGRIPNGRNPVEWAKQLEELGAGEILLTSIDRDGTMEGYDLQLIKAVSHAVNIPVIASGGAGTFSHMLEAIRDAQASAVAAASLYLFTQCTPLEAKAFLSKHGIPVRNHL